MRPAFRILLELDRAVLLSRWRNWRKQPLTLGLGMGMFLLLLWVLREALIRQSAQGVPSWAFPSALMFIAARQFYPAATSPYAHRLLRGPFYPLVAKPDDRRRWFALRAGLCATPVMGLLLALQISVAPAEAFFGLGVILLAGITGLCAGMIPLPVGQTSQTSLSRGVPMLSALLCRLSHNRLWLGSAAVAVLTPIGVRLALNNNSEASAGLIVFGMGMTVQALILCTVSVPMVRFMRFQPASLLGIVRQVSLAPCGLWCVLTVITILISGLTWPDALMIGSGLLVATMTVLIWFYLTHFTHTARTAPWVMGIDLAVATMLSLMALPASLIWLLARFVMLIRRLKRMRWQIDQL